MNCLHHYNFTQESKEYTMGNIIHQMECSLELTIFWCCHLDKWSGLMAHGFREASCLLPMLSFSLQKVINAPVLVKLLQSSGIVKITTHDLSKSVMSFTCCDGCAVLFYSKVVYLLELAKATQQKRVIIA
jgi:hypothetical protein